MKDEEEGGRLRGRDGRKYVGQVRKAVATTLDESGREVNKAVGNSRKIISIGISTNWLRRARKYLLEWKGGENHGS